MKLTNRGLLLLVSVLLIFSMETLSAQPPRIKQGLWKTVVRIESIIGTNGIPAVGTGFVVSKPIVRNGQTNRMSFLITNKHVIGDWNMADGDILRYAESLRIFFYASNQVPLTVAIKSEGGALKPFVRPHPQPRVDIAVIALLNEFFTSSEASLDVGFLLPFDSPHIGFGDQVFALGYPYGITSLQ